MRLLLLFLLVPASCTVTAGVTRTYYLAAEDVVWDYAPSYPVNRMHHGEFTDDEKLFLDGNGRDRIGRRYHKALYVEYEDSSFTRRKSRPPEWAHLGLLGPVIQANVGDTVRLVFKNHLAGMNASVHPHGLFYRKDSEGTPYDDGSEESEKHDDLVRPGETYTYTWEVPDRSGPGPADPSSIVWLYHSHVDETADTNTGLVGPIIISRRGERLPDGKLKGIDREFVVLFSVFDENRSLLLGRNIQEFAPQAERASDGFIESNLKHAINGYLFDNLPGLDMKTGEKVRWYQLALGTEVDLHTPHWHGNTVTDGGRRVDVLNLLPATHLTVDMEPDNPGKWMYHCHVNDHIDAGMMATYTVERGNPEIRGRGANHRGR